MIVAKRNTTGMHSYDIPVKKVRDWDKQISWLPIKECKVKDKYKDNTASDSSKNHIKNQRYYTLDRKNIPVLTCFSKEDRR
jgi:hypothetical protein